MYRLLFFLFGFAPVWAAAAAPAIPRADTPPPEVSAPAWVLVDYYSGWILAAHDARVSRPAGDFAKLMTTYVACDRIGAGDAELSHAVAVSDRVRGVSGPRMLLAVGDRVELGVLLQALAVQSANDAAVTLADFFGGEVGFVARMNARAGMLGLTDTHFTSSTGAADPAAHTSVADLSALARALRRNHPDCYRRYTAKEITYRGVTHYNPNPLLWRSDPADGVMAGSGESGKFGLIGSAQRPHMRLMVTVLGEPDQRRAADDVERLLAYGFKYYETRLLYGASLAATRVSVRRGAAPKLSIGPGRDVYVTLPRGTFDRLRANLVVKNDEFAPVKAGDWMGDLTLHYGDTVLGVYPIVALTSVPEGGWWRKFLDWIHHW